MFVMYRVDLKVSLRCYAGVVLRSAARQAIGRSLIIECIQRQMPITVIAFACSSEKDDVVVPDESIVTLMLFLGVGDSNLHRLPSIEALSRSVYSFLTVSYPDIVRQVESIWMWLQAVDGMVEAFYIGMLEYN
jgi:hypothetical protein